MADNRIVNIQDLRLADNGNGDAFVARIARAGPLIGSTGLGCTLTVLPPGKRAYPFHRHHVIDELFFILAGAGEYRIDDAREGDAVTVWRRLAEIVAEDGAAALVTVQAAVGSTPRPAGTRMVVRLPLRAGDLVAAPAGKEAHQIVNTSSADLCFLAISTIGEADIVEYPDTGKVAMAAGIKNADFKTATYKALGHLKPAEYFEGER